MTERATIHKAATRASLTAAMEKSPPHLRVILETVRDLGTAFLFVPQGPEAFRIPDEPRKPAIVLLGDDLEDCHGPDGFHMPSIRRAIRACSSFAIVSSAPQADAYEAIAQMAAATRRNVMLVETRLAQELAWLSLIQKLAPKRPILLATVEGGHA